MTPGLPKHTELRMPALSPTMKEGKIAKWNFKIGDKLEAGDVLAEIETDKSNVGFEMQESGYLAKILITESSLADVGKVAETYPASRNPSEQESRRAGFRKLHSWSQCHSSGSISLSSNPKLRPNNRLPRRLRYSLKLLDRPSPLTQS